VPDGVESNSDPQDAAPIWLGPRPAPLNWTESWRAVNPEFDYLMWGQREIAEFELRNAALFDRFVSEGIFDGAADVARAEIQYRRGGIYDDADSLAGRPLRGAPFLEAEFFAAAEQGDQLISNAFMGRSIRSSNAT
jgi:mannosyltransferase OCH1-like enzyme